MATSNRAVSGGEACPECGGGVRPEGTEQICVSCGLVVDAHEIDHGPEWRDFREDRAKIRAAPTDPDRQGKELGSEIGTWAERKRDGVARRQNRQHSRAKASTKRARNLRYVIGEVERITGALDLPETMEKQAVRLFRQLHGDRDVIGRDLDTLAATVVYTTLRVNQRGLTPDDVANVARSDAKRIARRHKWVCDTLGIGSPPPCPRQRVRVVASDVGLSRDVTARALARLDDVDDSVIYSGSPSTLAAALLWDESEETQRVIADAAGCTPASVRNRLEAVRSDAGEKEVSGQTTVGMF